MSGRIPHSFIDDLLTRVDVVDVIDGYVPLKKAGRDYKARCPFHDEKTPSFTVSQEKQFYHCFGCGANGTAIGFLMEHAGLSFHEAVEELASRAGLTVPYETPDGSPQAPRPADDRSDLYELMELAVRYYTRQLREHPQRERVVAYLKQRGLTGEIAAEFELGFAPPGWDNLLDNLGKSDPAIKRLASVGLLIEKDGGRGHYDRFRDRVMFPIRDRRGRAVGFGGRTLVKDEKEAKYINSPETPIFHKGTEVYGLYPAKKALRQMDRIYVVEGYMDVVALAQNGVRNAVATLGTACTRDHLETLFRTAPQVVLCFDGDEAGQRAAFRAMETGLPLLREGRELAFMFMPESDDPDTFVRREGPQAFTDLARLTPLSDYLIGQLRRDISITNREGKAKFADRAKGYVRMLPGTSLRDLLIRQISDLTGIHEFELKADLDVESTPGRPPSATANRPGPRAGRAKQAPSLVGHMIAMLLQQPKLAMDVESPRAFEPVDLPGLDFLIELLEFAHSRPDITTGAILEHWRGSRYEQRLSELASLRTGRDGEELDWSAEFRDAVARLNDLLRRQRLQALRQVAWNELSDSQKEELRALTTAVGRAD